MVPSPHHDLVQPTEIEPASGAVRKDFAHDLATGKGELEEVTQPSEKRGDRERNHELTRGLACPPRHNRIHELAFHSIQARQSDPDSRWNLHSEESFHRRDRIGDRTHGPGLLGLEQEIFPVESAGDQS